MHHSVKIVCDKNKLFYLFINDILSEWECMMWAKALHKN